MSPIAKFAAAAESASTGSNGADAKIAAAGSVSTGSNDTVAKSAAAGGCVSTGSNDTVAKIAAAAESVSTGSYGSYAQNDRISPAPSYTARCSGIDFATPKACADTCDHFTTTNQKRSQKPKNYRFTRRSR